MDKRDTEAVVNRVVASWGMNVTDRVEMYRAWHHFLADLEPDHVNRAVDRLAVLSGPPPRPGDVRKAAIDIADPSGRVPSQSEALAMARELGDAVVSGADRPDVHPLVVQMVRMAGGGSNYDFAQSYRDLAPDWIARRYEVADEG